MTVGGIGKVLYLMEGQKRILADLAGSFYSRTHRFMEVIHSWIWMSPVVGKGLLIK